MRGVPPRHPEPQGDFSRVGRGASPANWHLPDLAAARAWPLAAGARDSVSERRPGPSGGLPAGRDFLWRPPAVLLEPSRPPPLTRSQLFSRKRRPALFGFGGSLPDA